MWKSASVSDAGVVAGTPTLGMGSATSVNSLLLSMNEVIGKVAGSSPGDGAEILSYLMDVSRSWTTHNRGAQVPHEIASRAMLAAEKRRRGAPIQYCVGLAAFRSLTLAVDERVLIPRPETELLVEHVLFRARTGTAVDIGTGSGAIAISLACDGAFDRVVATDISVDALSVARGNAQRHLERMTAAVEFVHGSGVDPVRGIRADVVVSNPPYIAFEELLLLDASVRDWEPPIALTAADDGLETTALILKGAVDILKAGGLLALEVDCRRAARVAQLAAQDGRYRDISVVTDFTGRDRFVFAKRIDS